MLTRSGHYSPWCIRFYVLFVSIIWYRDTRPLTLKSHPSPSYWHFQSSPSSPDLISCGNQYIQIRYCGISSPTVQVAERLDGCDPYFRRSITPTLRFKCQDIIRFPILPTKHNPQALRTGGEIHQYFFGWIDTSRINVVGRRHLSIDNYVHTHIVRRTIFAPRRGIICVCYLFAEYEHYIFDIWQETRHFCQFRFAVFHWLGNLVT